MTDRSFKDPLYAEFARLGHAVAAPRRLELLDLLAQGEKAVDQLARQSHTPIKNTSAHLRVLRQARLVETRREGQRIYYRLAHPGVHRLLRSLQDLARARLAEVEHVTRAYLGRRDELAPVTLAELRRLIRDDAVVVLDVRPRDEYGAGHIAGARSIPLAELRRRLPELPRSREIVAYCRGPFCVFAADAVRLLRRAGYRARRFDLGFPDWQTAGLAVSSDPDRLRTRVASR